MNQHLSASEMNCKTCTFIFIAVLILVTVTVETIGSIIVVLIQPSENVEIIKRG